MLEGPMTAISGQFVLSFLFFFSSAHARADLREHILPRVEKKFLSKGGEHPKKPRLC